jgi:hypothetical protein
MGKSFISDFVKAKSNGQNGYRTDASLDFVWVKAGDT